MQKRPNEMDLDDLEGRRMKLYAALEGEDDLGVVLRAHIHIEHELKEFALVSAPNPEELKFSHFDYDSVVALALALGLNPALKGALSAIGNLRNKFAHNLDRALSEQDGNNVYNALSPDMKTDAQDGYNNFRKRPKYADLPKSMMKLPPKRLFGICVVQVHMAILVQILHVYERVLEGGHGKKA
jgi:hypothetical protein